MMVYLLASGVMRHIARVLWGRASIMILADFTAPEGTVLNMGDQDVL